MEQETKKAKAPKAEKVEQKIEKKVEKKPEWEIKSRIYRLTGNKTPLTFTIQTKHTRKKPLLYWDEEAGQNRELRYATNQPSVFVDEQDGYSTLGHVVFTDGALIVDRKDQSLQKLLSLYHPHAGVKLFEFDPTKREKELLEVIEGEVDALVLVTEMEPEHIEALLRAEYGKEASTWEPKIQKRRAFALAKNHPKLFVQLAKDEDLKLLGTVGAAFDYGILKEINGGRNVTYNGKTVLTVPFESTPTSATVQFLKTDEGVELLKSISKKLS